MKGKNPVHYPFCSQQMMANDYQQNAYAFCTINIAKSIFCF